jgi:hypothetical protein
MVFGNLRALPLAMTEFAIYGGVDHRGAVGKAAPDSPRINFSLRSGLDESDCQ